MTQFLETYVNKSISTTNTWIDIDLSGDIPVGATGAIFRVRNTAASWQKSGLRKKGSTDDRYGEVESVSHGYYIIAVDANRKCQGKIESTSIKFDLIGYTECDITLYTNGIDKSITPWNTWTDIDLSSELPVGAVAAIFEVKNTAAAPRMWSLRNKGSTDERYNDCCSTRNTCFVVGVDGNRKCQGKIEDTQIDFYFIGYLTSGAAEINGIDHSLGSLNTYIDITETNAPAGSTGVFVDYLTLQMSTDYAARKKGSSEDVYLDPSARHTGFFVGIDSNKQWQGKIEHIDNDFFTLGYFAPGVTEVTKESSGGLAISETKTKASSAGLLVAPPLFEDFTTFTEVDVPENRILKNVNQITHEAHRNESTYLYKDYGLGRFSDFEHKIKARINITSEASGFNYIWMLANDLGDGYALNHNDKNNISVYFYIDSSYLAIKVKESYNGTSYVDQYSVPKHDDWRYIKITKSGTDFKVRIYSDANYSTLLDTLSLTLHNQDNYRYLYGTNSHNSGDTQILDADIDNFNLGPEKTKLSSIGLSIQTTNTKESSIGISVVDRKTKNSSIELSIQTTNTKESSIGCSIRETKIKNSSIELSIQTTNTKESSIGCSIRETKIKNSSIELSIQTTNTKESSIGCSIRETKIKNSSIELSIQTTNTKESSIGCSIRETKIKNSSIGLYITSGGISQPRQNKKSGIFVFDRISEDGRIEISPGLLEDGYITRFKQIKIKESSIGLDIIGSVLKPSLIGLCIFETKIKSLSIGISIVIQKTKVLSIGLSIQLKKTKNVSIGLSITSIETEKNTSIGLNVVDQNIKNSSVSLTVLNVYKKSLIGLKVILSARLEKGSGIFIFDGISEDGRIEISPRLLEDGNTKKTQRHIIKESNIGMSIRETSFKASLIGLCIQSQKTKTTSIGLSIQIQKTKNSLIGMYVSGTNTNVSIISITVVAKVLEKGLFYGKLGDTILETVEPERFRISEEINRIPTFEFEVANSEANRTAIAANLTALFKIYWQHHGVDTHIFTGIINADGIEYISLSNIRITGFASYAKLGWPLYKHLNSEDAEPVNKVFEYHGAYTDYTTAANNATINDVIISFADVNHCFYVGEANPFWGLQVKYSTKGVPAGAVVIIEFSKGVGIWGTLHVLDETNAFVEDPGTYDIIIPHPPSDWARNTVNGVSKFWIRWRVISGAYTTAPKLDQIHTVNVDVYRVFYYETSAREILLDVLEGTEYSMDAIDACPEDEINIWAEYESPLRIIAAIPAALTWTDTDGSKKSYQWWIDEAKKVHIKQKRGTTYLDDITGDLTIFNNLIDYFNVSNRLIGFSKRDGLSQIRAIIEDKPSQTTHALREIAVPKNEIGKYLTLKASLEKDITYSKDPMQRIKGSVSTEFWGLRNYEVGDTVTLHQGEWVVDEGEFQIVKADIGPIFTQLNLGISREHLDGLKSNMKRAFDISNVQMHGSTSLLTAGPETANYERKCDGSVFSAKLKIEIPSEVIKTHKVLLSWTIGKYRASVNDNSGDVPPHNHGGSANIGGAILSDLTGDDGGFTPEVSLDGLHTPVMIDGLHKHKLKGAISYAVDSITCRGVTSDSIAGGSHRHSGGGTGYSNSNADALIPPLYMGSACSSGRCVTGVYGASFATSSHYHQNSDTGYTTPNMSIYVTQQAEFLVGIQWIEIDIYSDQEDPVHEHTGSEVQKHDHQGVAESDHDHVTPAVTGHTDHGITAEAQYTVPVSYGIHEEAAGTVLELLVNSEKIGEFSGPQTDVRIDGYLTSSTNTVEIQPVSSELGKKGSATISASGILFLEPRKF